jgi:23S rRNA (uracil1939-C5)-methyltransferase
MKFGILKNIRIEALAAEGKSIARTEGKVVFVDHGAPGDLVDIQITRKKKNYLEGYVIQFHEYSPIREIPFCEHFGTCGGCKWQHIPYFMQLENKQQQVIDNLTRIGKISLPEVNPIKGSNLTKYYRNKLEYTFSSVRWLEKQEIETGDEMDRNGLGFHIPGKFDKVLDIKNCYLQPEPSNRIREEVKTFAMAHKMPFFNIRQGEGLMRNLIIRTSGTGEIMVIVQFFHEDERNEKLLAHVKNTFPEVTSLMYVINPKKNETFNDLEVKCFSGNPFILEKMEEIHFRVGPKSFFQTNFHQAFELYKLTREFAGLTGNEIVYDLYTGTGTIANFVAARAKKVIGLEYVEMAIQDAKINSEINGILNTEFYAGDIKDLLNQDFLRKHGKPDVVITDPPRAGMHEDVVKMLLQSAAERIVYVSCNPATQARDLAILDPLYKVTRVQPVDMFPQTHHVENIALLELRK